MKNQTLTKSAILQSEEYDQYRIEFEDIITGTETIASIYNIPDLSN